jgi:exonuclease SbcD
MTCADSDEEFDAGDFRTPIHLFRTIRGLPTTIFDGFAYGALGQIHRHHRVGESRAWYAGSPVPINVIEARTDLYVIDVDLSLPKPTVKPVRLPCWRNVFELS